MLLIRAISDHSVLKTYQQLKRMQLYKYMQLNTFLLENVTISLELSLRESRSGYIYFSSEPKTVFTQSAAPNKGLHCLLI